MQNADCLNMIRCKSYQENICTGPFSLDEALSKEKELQLVRVFGFYSHSCSLG